MKKFASLILAAMMLLALTACGQKQASSQDTAPLTKEKTQTETAAADNAGAAAAPAQGASKQYSFQVSSYKVKDDRYSDDKSALLASSEYEIPKVTPLHANGTPFDMTAEANTPEAAAAAAINQYFTDWLAKEQEWFEEVVQMARKDYADNGAQPYSLWQSSSYYYADTMGFNSWQNDKLLCIVMESYNFTGGVHGYSGKTAVIFDLATGKVMTPGELVSDFSGMTNAVTQEILRQIQNGDLAAQYGMDAYFDDYKETVNDWMERAVSFDDTGMNVVFAVYDITPYAHGEQSFHISYDILSPYLNATGHGMLGI